MMSKGRQIEIIILFVIITIALLYLFCDQRRHQKIPELDVPEGFTALFNGEDFSGWKSIPDNQVFYIEDKMIICSGESGYPNVLLTEKQYENFILHIDFKMHPSGKTGNSGIFIHVPAYGRQSKTGFEVQILDTFGHSPSKNSAGAIYDLVAPDTNAVLPPGEWNHYEIEVDWPQVKVSLNGVRIQNVDFSADHNMKYRRRIGYIGLQNHENPVAFRNIFIRELPSKIAYEPLFNGENSDSLHTIGETTWQVADGQIKAFGGAGFLVSEKEYQNFELFTYIKNTPANYGGIYFRWLDESDPGYLAEFYNLQDAIKYTQNGQNILAGTLPVFSNYDYLPFQIIAVNRQSEVRINGSIAAQNLIRQKIRPGKIALFFHPKNDTLWIKELMVRELDEW